MARNTQSIPYPRAAERCGLAASVDAIGMNRTRAVSLLSLAPHHSTKGHTSRARAALNRRATLSPVRHAGVTPDRGLREKRHGLYLRKWRERRSDFRRSSKLGTVSGLQSEKRAAQVVRNAEYVYDVQLIDAIWIEMRRSTRPSQNRLPWSQSLETLVCDGKIVLTLRSSRRERACWAKVRASEATDSEHLREEKLALV